MKDFKHCPICFNLCRKEKIPAFWIYKEKEVSSNFLWKITCSGLMHFFKVFIDPINLSVCRMDLGWDYKTYISIDYIKGTSEIDIGCDKVRPMQVNYLLEPDFPSLSSLKEKIKKYICFI